MSPKQTFKEDALRILRVIRLAAELGFSVEEKTYIASKEMLPGIKIFHMKGYKKSLIK